MTDAPATLSTFGEDDSERHAQLRPALTFVLCSDRLGASSVRVELDPARPVEVGRGDGAEAVVSDDRSRLRIPDLRMSGRHARLLPTAAGWLFEDVGSKNGSRVDGVPVTRPVPLEDGQVLELGHSFFVFREDVPWRDLVSEPPPASTEPLVTLDASLAGRFHDLGRVAESDLTVMVQGESGVGKEVAARTVHARSGRSGPFVPVNCGALPDTLVEAELFGSARGAFSGADRDRAGYLRSADGGTLFLDEVGELSLLAQVKLLRALQERAATPLGETRAVPTDFRLVTATNRDLRTAVREGSFRGDLLARIAGFELAMPPLRRRREDLGLLIRRMARIRGVEVADHRFTRLLARLLMAHAWPYNIRELEKGFALALTFADNGRMDCASFPLEEDQAEPSLTVAPLSPEDEARRRELIRLLDEHGGNISQIARSMGKARMQIHRWLKLYGLDARLSRVRRAKSDASDGDRS